MATPSIYNSTPLSLDDKSIRVLVLEPSRRSSDALVCNLEVVSLEYPTEDRLPSFHALSYVWGDYNSPKDTLMCGTFQLPITRNCRDALRAVRSFYKAPVTIWVDAICINQGDVVEKEHQIRLMSDIYTCADVVDIWLGQGCRDVWQAMKWLSKAAETNYLPLERIRSYRDPAHPRLTKFSTETFATAIRRVMGYYSMDSHDFERCMDSFLRQEWFLRAWTFQEAILSSHSRFICGSRYLDWDTVVQGMAVLRFNFKDNALEFFRRSPTIYYPQLRPIDRRSRHPTDRNRRIQLRSSFCAFDRFVQLWMKLRRPRLGEHSSRYTLGPSPKQSSYSMQGALAFYLRNTSVHDRLLLALAERPFS
jgi:hypothetical protein